MFLPANNAASPTSYGDSSPAPVGGWNARDPLAMMGKYDAIFLDNFFPRPGDIQLRRGSAPWATVPEGERVRSLLVYNGLKGFSRMFACTDYGIYDVSRSREVPPKVSDSANGAFEAVNISTAGGNFLWCCNGNGPAKVYNGETWTDLSPTSTPPLTGIPSEKVTAVTLFKSRLFLCRRHSLSFYYLPVNSIAGEAQEFPLGAIFRRGGYLAAIGTWTLDGGNGPDDYLAIVTSEGEVAIYAGTDPSNAATWGLKGVYEIGAPLGKRCLFKFGGDLLFLSVRGLFPLSKALQSAVVDARSAVSDKISNAWVDYAQQYQNLFGWQIESAPNLSMLLVNVPVQYQNPAFPVDSVQFVMNTQTGSWTRFTGMPAEAWAYFNSRLHFARGNTVYVAWEGGSDVQAEFVEPQPIEGSVRTAFFYPGGRGNLTRVTMLRPLVSSNGGNLSFQLGVDHDYANRGLSGNQLTFPQNGSLWDVGEWDDALWFDNDPRAATLTAQWKSVNHYPGRALALRLRVRSKDVSMIWTATDFILQKGGMM